jgi:acetyl-CoA carboxylase biotin carboxyl carrier protein
MDLKEIEGIIKLVEDSTINELEIEEGESRIRVVKGGVPVQPVSVEHTIPPPVYPATTPATTPPAATEEEVADDDSVTVTSPMVGTFYRAPSPDSPSFVQIGGEVQPETVVCILEAMKVMNEIKAGCQGKIAEILVENAQAVEFSQPLFKVTPF